MHANTLCHFLFGGLRTLQAVLNSFFPQVFPIVVSKMVNKVIFNIIIVIIIILSLIFQASVIVFYVR